MYKKFLAGLLSFTVCTSAIFPTFITAAETASPAVTAESAEAVQILPHKNMENIYNLTSWVKTPEIPTDAKVIESGSLGEKVTFKLYDNGVLSIEGSGAMTADSVIENKDKVTEIAFGNGVTTIESGIFTELTSLKKLYIPSTVNSIADCSFARCTSLTDVVIEGEEKTLGRGIIEGCTAIETVTLPFCSNTLENTNANKGYPVMHVLFSGRSYPDTYVVGNGGWGYVPNSLTTINITGGNVVTSGAFKGLISLKEVNLADSIKDIGYMSFYGCTALQTVEADVISTMDFGAFEGCSSLLNILNCSDSIGSRAYCGCTSLREVETKAALGSVAFGSCTNLKKAVIRKETPSISVSIFDGCSSLEEVFIPYLNTTLNDSDNEKKAYNAALLLFGSTGGEGMYEIYSQSWFYIPESLKKITVTGGKRVPAKAFAALSKVEQIVLYDTIENIGENAFEGCTALSTLKCSEKIENVGDYAFSGCESLTKPIASIENIGNYAYAGCKKMGNVTFSEATKTIGDFAFSDCTSMTKVNVPSTIESVGSGAFAGCQAVTDAVIESGVKKLGDAMFSRCISLERVTLPYCSNTLEDSKNDETPSVANLLFAYESVDAEKEYEIYNNNWLKVPKSLNEITILGGKAIPSMAFCNLSEVKKIALPETVEIIGEKAFENCAGLTDLVCSDKLAEISANAFLNCASLPKVIPYADKIGDSAYEGCNALTNVAINGKEIGSSVFRNCKGIKKAVLGKDFETIGNSIFAGCESVEEITVPFAANSLEEIESGSNTNPLPIILLGYRDIEKGYEFHNGGWVTAPDSLKRINVENGDIPSNAFGGLEKLETLGLGNSVKTIAENAFGNCKALADVYYNGTKEEWSKVKVDSDEIKAATIHFNDSGAVTTTTKPVTTTAKTTTTTTKATTTAKPVTTTTTTTTKPVTTPAVTTQTIMLGDVDESGIIDAADASTVLAAYAAVQTGSKSPLTEAQQKTADVDENGTVDASDASSILAFYAYKQTGGKDDFVSFIKAR